MHLKTQQISVANLEIGMYVSRLDVPWVKTPFPIQGFYITKEDEIALLSQYCNYVYIDTILSKIDNTAIKHAHYAPGAKDPIDPKTRRLMNEKARMKARVENYKVTTPIRKELKTADKIYTNMTNTISATLAQIENGEPIQLNQVEKSIRKMVDSVIRNPDALVWMCRIRQENAYLFESSIRASVWGLVFARHLGLSRKDLNDVGAALILSSIGKSKLPRELHIGELEEAEQEAYKAHIEKTLEELEYMGAVNGQIKFIISNYCERNNGSGYPRGLIGNRIPFLARVAGIADYYEQLINPRPGIEAMTPVEAVADLYHNRGILFQREMVEAFIQAIGIYPTGSLVELSDHSIGIVLEQKEKSRLRPKVALVRNHYGIDLEQSKIIDLSENTPDANGAPLEVLQSLPSSAVEVNTDILTDKLFGFKWFGMAS
jgi:HD-GYP domain-containing protein (c-di-GMP phosphodiesterase class II)